MTRASRGGLALYASSGRLDGHPDSVPPPVPQVPPPREVHEPYLPDDKLFEPEVAPIRLLEGKTQGPGRLGDLMRAARRP